MSCPVIFLLENAPVAFAFMALNLVYFFVMFIRYMIGKAEGPFERGLYLVTTTIMYVIFAIIGNGIFWRALLVEFVAIFAVFTAITAVAGIAFVLYFIYNIICYIIFGFFDFFFGVDVSDYEPFTFFSNLREKKKYPPHYYDNDDYHYHY